jgi:hypothetical protein
MANKTRIGMANASLVNTYIVASFGIFPPEV